jgi:hypothetical protein
VMPSKEPSTMPSMEPSNLGLAELALVSAGSRAWTCYGIISGGRASQVDVARAQSVDDHIGQNDVSVVV